MNYQSLRCLATGGAGFIGSTLVKRLVDCGANVSVVDILWRGSLEKSQTARAKFWGGSSRPWI